MLHAAMVQVMKHAASLRAMVQAHLVQVLRAALVLATKRAASLHAMAQVLRVQVQARHAQVRVLHVLVRVLHAPAQVQVLNAAQPAVRHKADVTAIAMATSGKNWA